MLTTVVADATPCRTESDVHYECEVQKLAIQHTADVAFARVVTSILLTTCPARYIHMVACTDRGPSPAPSKVPQYTKRGMHQISIPGYRRLDALQNALIRHVLKCLHRRARTET